MLPQTKDIIQGVKNLCIYKWKQCNGTVQQLFESILINNCNLYIQKDAIYVL